MRKWLKPLQNPIEYEMKVIHLCGLLWLEKRGWIQLYYGDESRISMNSYLPSCWQEKGKSVAIIPKKSVGLNVFGLLNRKMDFHPYTRDCSINSALTIAFIDDFLKQAQAGLKIIVLDNASIHHSEEFKDQLERWSNKIY